MIDKTSFKASVFGIYLVGYIVNVEIKQPASIQSCLQISHTSKCGGTLIAKHNSSDASKDATLKHSLQATGVIKLYAGDEISLLLESNKQWKSGLGSIFFGHLVREYGYLPAFYASPSTRYELRNARDPRLRSWDVTGKPGSFKSSREFSENYGVFSVTQSGFYFVSTNLVIEKGSGVKQYRLGVSSNQQRITDDVIEAPSRTTVTTLQSSTLLKFDANVNIFLYIKTIGNSKSVVLPQSSFSVAMLHQGIRNANWHHLTSSVVTQFGKIHKWIDFNGFSEEKVDNGTSNTLRADSAGVYLLCLNWKILFSAPDMGHFSVKTWSEQSLKTLLLSNQDIDVFQKTTISTTNVVVLAKGDIVTVEVTSSLQSWFLDKGSSISLLKLQEIYSAFGLSAPFVSTKFSNVWVKFSDLELSKNKEDFSFTADPMQGNYVIHRAGIYFVSANVVLGNLVSATVHACIAVDDKPSVADGLTTISAGASGKSTIAVSSAIFLRKGQKVGVYMKIESHTGWQLRKGSSFSVVFLGSVSVAVGFQTTLFADITQRSTGWNTPSSWNRICDVTSMPWSFASNAQLSQFGVFAAPVTGVYLTTANVIVGNVDLIDEQSAFIAMISVNKETGSDLLYLRKTSKIAPTQSDVRNDIAFNIAATLYLKKGDTVSVKVCSKADSFWTIRKSTGFSVVLVSTMKQGTTNAFLALMHNATDNASVGTSISNWATSGVDPRMFKLGDDILSEDTVRISHNGIYVISLNFHVKADSMAEISIGFMDPRTKRATICAVNTQLYRSSFISCHVVLYLSEGYSFKVFLRSSEIRKKIIVNRACYFSLFKIERPVSYPWFYAELEVRSLNSFVSFFTVADLGGQLGA